MRLTSSFWAAFLLVGCGGGGTAPGGDGGGGADMAMKINDLAVNPGDGSGGGGDMAQGGMCMPDPMTDGQPCGNGCPVNSGTIPVNSGGSCNCWYTCTPMQPNTCPCGRACAALFTQTDAGPMPNGMGACIPANGGGERCGQDAMGKPYGKGNCQDGTLCVNEDQAGKFAYCMYRCTRQADCPMGTTCLPLQGGGNVCAINTNEMGPTAGMPCMNGLCKTANVCDGMTCQMQCNGPSDMTTCTGGTKCTAMVDMANMKIAAYVCK